MNKQWALCAALPVALCLTTNVAEAQTWYKYSTGIQQIAAGYDGAVWALNTNNQIVKMPVGSTGAIAWQVMPSIPSALSSTAVAGSTPPVKLAVGGANQVFATDTINGLAYRWTGSAWQVAQGENPGAISYIAAAADGSVRAVAASQPLLLTPCLTASNVGSDDWSWLPNTPVESSAFASIPPPPPVLTAIAGTAGNLWALDVRRGAAQPQIVYWNALNHPANPDPKLATSWWEPAPSPGGGRVVSIDVGGDGAVFAVAIGADNLWGIWKATVTPPCTSGLACKPLPPGTLLSNTVTWTLMKGTPPGLVKIAVVDQNRLWGVTSNGDTYASF